MSGIFGGFSKRGVLRDPHEYEDYKRILGGPSYDLVGILKGPVR